MIQSSLQTFLFICVFIEVKNTPIYIRDREPKPVFTGFMEPFCRGNHDIVSKFSNGVSSGYNVVIKKYLEATTDIIVKLDSGGMIVFGDNFFSPVNDTAKLTERDIINNVFGFILRKSTDHFTFTVKGRSAPNHPPYIISLKIDGEEKCADPDRTYFEKFPVGVEEMWPEAPDKFCGRRRINREYTELIVKGSPSITGNWPWHTAIFRNEGRTVQYICGGTLISKFFVLTAAHCVTINDVPVNPELLGVVLGKHSLIGSDRTSQYRTIYKVFVHDDFKKLGLENDIALLTLSTEASFNNYVQPACIWLDKAYDKLESYQIIGTVVGWGVDETNFVSNDLHEAIIPLVPNLTCVTYDPVFYTSVLSNRKKYCAGNGNGTAACNGDSGGGFVVFVPDSNELNNTLDYQPGAWYVRGIVSTTLKRAGSSLCDTNAYTVFTDVEKYRDWIINKMDSK